MGTNVARGDLTEPEWRVIGKLLPPERGRSARPAQDNRRFLNGMLWILRTGAPWRDLPESYGKWISVYQRFRRWANQGVWDALLEILVDLGLTDDWKHMVDTTSVRAHSQAAGGKGGLLRMRLVEAAAALRRRSMPVLMVGDDLLASS
jgi:transposase